MRAINLFSAVAIVAICLSVVGTVVCEAANASLSWYTVRSYKYDGYYFENHKSTDSVMLYNFSDKSSTGICRDDTIINSSACYGIKAEKIGNKIYVSSYNNYPTEYTPKVKKISLIFKDKEYHLNANGFEQKIDLNKYKENGLYEIKAEIEESGKTKDFCLYFYVEGTSTYLCNARIAKKREVKALTRRYSIIKNKLEEYNITPENAISTDDLAYPVPSFNGKNRCDTENWKEFSYDLVQPNMPDDSKVFMFHEWFSKYTAYDTWRWQNLPCPRDWFNRDFSGKYSLYDTGVGVCCDFSNAFVIMCREQGIPCVTLDNDKHTWTLVYINDVWVEMDLTKDVLNKVESEDMSLWTRPDNPYSYKGYNNLGYVNEIKYINYYLTTNDNYYFFTSEELATYREALND